MQTRHTRFELRFETGRRAGERFELGEGVHTLGRGQDNTIPLFDAAVSGRHAELIVSPDEVRVVDLDSTNGTRVGGRPVDSARLAHGDRLSVGGVEIVLFDRRFEQDGAPDTVQGPARGASAPRRRRRPWLLLSLPLVLLAALGYWKVRASARVGPAAAALAVVDVPGNLLANGSFESEEAPAWDAPSAAPRAMRRAARHARSGSAGLGVELGVDEWSLFRSPSFPVSGVRALRLGASVRAEDTAGATARGMVRLGIERLGLDGRRLVSWSAPATDSGAFEELELVAPIAPGWDEARMVLAARGPGTFSLDDASALRVPPLPPLAAFLEDELFSAGERPTSLSVVRGGRAVLEAALSGWSENGLRGAGSGFLQAQAVEDGFRISVRECGPQESVTLLLEASGEDPWAATLGPSGFRSHAGELSVDDATDVILGAGIETLRVAFAESRAVRGGLDGARLRVSAPVEDGAELRVQLRFRAELALADLLRERALAAEARGEPAAALELWGELLARVPLRGTLVREAQVACTRLVASGLQAIEELRRAVQRARFFALPALYRETLRRAEELALAYRGTELQPIADQLSAEVADELGLCARRRAEEQQERLRAVLDSRQVAGSPALSERLREELARLARVDGGGR